MVTGILLLNFAEDAARIIQSYYRRLVERRKFINLMNQISFLQRFIKAWLNRRRKLACTEPDAPRSLSCGMVFCIWLDCF